MEETDKEIKENGDLDVEKEKQEQEVTSSVVEEGRSDEKVELTENNGHSDKDEAVEASENACESVMKAIMADMAVQMSDNGTSRDQKEVEVISEERECAGKREKDIVAASEETGMEGKGSRRGGRKRWNKEGKGQKNAKRKKTQMDTSLHNVPARKPTLLEKV